MSDRKGYRYEEKHPITQNNFPPIPLHITQIAIDVANDYELSIRPESALINWYSLDSKLRLHVDSTEESLAPVVSL